MDKQRIKSVNKKGQITSHWGPQEEKLFFISHCNAYFRIILQKKLSDVKLPYNVLGVSDASCDGPFPGYGS